MCTSCRGRFNLPPVSNGCCEVCSTLQRLNRLVLTRHPADEAETLYRLLARTTSKIESFVEEWESIQALRGTGFGGVSLGGGRERPNEPVETSLPGLKPVAKSSSAHSRRKAGESPDQKRAEDKRRSLKASRSRERPRSKVRTSPPERKEKKRRPVTPQRREALEAERSPRVRRPVKEEEEEPARRAAAEGVEDVEADFGDTSEESTVRDDRRSPQSRHHDAPRTPERREDRIPKPPSHSPPGFARSHRGDEEEREPIQRKEKPKKDKGYNHYIRGREYREKHGQNRGRGGGYSGGRPW